MAKDNNKNESGARSFSVLLLDSIRKAHECFLATDDSGEVFKFLLESLISLTDSEYGFLDEVLRDDKGELYKLSLALSDISWDDDSRKLYNDLIARNLEFRNLSGTPAMSGKLVIANDAPHDSRSGGLPAGHPSILAYIGLPLYFGGKLVGVAGVANRPGGYDENLAKELEPFLSTCASMIHAMRQREKEKAHFKEIENANQTMNAILRASPESSFLIDTNGIVLNGNAVFAERLGRSIDELLGKNVFDYLPEGIAESRRIVVNEVIESGKPIQFEETRNDRIFRHHIFPIRDHRGTIYRLAIFVTDITEQKRSEQALQESANTFRSIFEDSPILMSLSSIEDGRYTDVNRTFLASTGFHRDQVIGKTSTEIGFINKVDREELKKKIIEEGSIYNWELALHKKNGNAMACLYSATLVQDGEDQRILSLAIDITEKKNLEKSIEESRQHLMNANLALEQKNIALQELMNQIQEKQNHLENDIEINIEKLIRPLLRQLAEQSSDTTGPLIELLEDNLEKLTSSKSAKLAARMQGLSKREVEICNYIRAGKTTRQIAQILHISPHSVDNHRLSIRKKLGVTGKHISLNSLFK